MEKIIIVECYSSAVNYIHDIRKLGFEPILLELYVSGSERSKIREINDRVYTYNGDELPTVIMASESYNETIAVVRELSPVLILAGCDIGLELAMRLSADLGLKGNPAENYEILRDKKSMQDALQRADLRFIRTATISSEKDALDFYHSTSNRKVVIKLSRSAGSYCVFVCSSENEVINAFHKTISCLGPRKREGEKVVIQEYIEGEEYVVDTISCAGRHAALFGMKYEKRFCKGFGMIYDTDLYISPDAPEMDKTTEYVFTVLDCLGVQYGPVHTEVKIDNNGPVLIEVNCRPAGVMQKYSFQDKVMQNHETAAALDSYFMDREEFEAKYPHRMHLKQPAAVKQICLEKDIYVKKVRLNECLSTLKSFEYVIDNGENCIYHKTVDLDSHGGMIYLTAPDEETIKHDLEYIFELEKNGLDRLYDIDHSLTEG